MTKDEIQGILALVAFEDWTFFLGQDGERLYLQIRVDSGIDNVTGERIAWSGRKWMLSPFMCKNEIVETAWKAIQTAVMHETREKFKYRGRTIFDPHFDPDKLWELRGQPDCLDERPGSQFGT
ncbi:MAG: hypothetical protein HOO96_06130 [Polyangiaceae bacterium]|nr:hypothetical protein [Polyangiaceae bacterium]